MTIHIRERYQHFIFVFLLESCADQWLHLQKEKCAYTPGKKVDVIVKEGKRLKSGIDKDLATAIYNYGPVAIAIHVTKDMASYKSVNY